MTRAEVRALVRKRLGETTAAFWSDSELNGWIDDAGHDLAYKTNCIRDNSKIDITQNDYEYTLSNKISSVLSVLKAYFYQNGSTWKKLTKTTRDELSEEHSGWRSASSGVPTKYYWSREEDLIGFYVPPDSSNYGSEYAHIYYAKKFTEIANDGTEISTIPQGLHLAMADFTVAQGLETRGYIEKSNDAWTKYLSRIQTYYTVRERDKMQDGGVRMKPPGA